MSVDGIGLLERGVRRSPYRETAALLVKALGLSPAAAAEFETAAARPRQPRGRSDPESSVADGGGDSATNLPFPRTSLIGREADIQEIAGILQEGRLVTVTGAGGVGKSRTALAVGDAVRRSAQTEVWLVELASLKQGSFVASTIAQVLRLQESSNCSVLETLLANLKKKALLLILDNCEHVIAETAPLVAALLRDCQDLSILTTSREPLRIDGERTYRLPSLGVPQPADGSAAFKYEAEKNRSGMTALAGLPTYLDLASVCGLQASIDRHVGVRRSTQGWSDAQVLMSLILLNLAGGDCVDDLSILQGDPGFAELMLTGALGVERLTELLADGAML
jgi:hypothetical protein